MKSNRLYGTFKGNTAIFNIGDLSDMLYDLFEEMGLEITHLRWDSEKKQFDISFETIKDDS